MLRDEQEVKPTWLKPTGADAPFERAAYIQGELYFPIQLFNITKADVAQWFYEREIGQAFVTKQNDVYIAGSTVVLMLEIQGNEQIEEFKQLLYRLTQQVEEDLLTHRREWGNIL